MTSLHFGTAAWLALALAGAARAQSTADALQLRSLAATCAACHGTDGRAVAGAAMPALQGRSRDELLAQLNALRDGSRPSTVMQQIARGYTPAQLAQLAAYFAAPAP